MPQSGNQNSTTFDFERSGGRPLPQFDFEDLVKENGFNAAVTGADIILESAGTFTFDVIGIDADPGNNILFSSNIANLDTFAWVTGGQVTEYPQFSQSISFDAGLLDSSVFGFIGHDRARNGNGFSNRVQVGLNSPQGDQRRLSLPA